MSQKQLMKAWKDQDFRQTLDSNPEHPSGKGFHEMSLEEMMSVTGAAEASPQATPTISVISKISASAISRSSKACISGGVSAISGIVSYNKECLG